MGLKRHRDRTWMLPPREVKNRSKYYSCGCKPFTRVKKSTMRKASSAGWVFLLEFMRLCIKVYVIKERLKFINLQNNIIYSNTTLNSFSLLSRRLSVNKPEIVIDEVSILSPNNMSISAGGNTTFRWVRLGSFISLILHSPHFRRSSDDGIRRSSSEVIGGVVFPSNYNSRRGSGMSNSSASLQLNDMHKISEQSQHEAEIFV
jgi:hypothetical protein